ncbi:hypothetical protein OUZ56_001428 [Daphnia magna]|uniref:Secreted protein n=1 Tax=Daphnia magna TaxID=35525 RepID=A0ABR0A2Q0_9CRUS|nr:hypothetical protein OUZ56_001428 [Daphnia magna]
MGGFSLFVKFLHSSPEVALIPFPVCHLLEPSRSRLRRPNTVEPKEDYFHTRRRGGVAPSSAFACNPFQTGR